MSSSLDRRAFLQTTAAAGAATAFLSQVPAVAADEARVDPQLVRLHPDIEPLVRLIEDTPRTKLLEEIGARIKKGLSYREVLTALFLAGVRNVQPRPNVGFKFHAVLVVNSAHQAALAGPDSERWLPLFWALDNFKAAQATNLKESGWRMTPVEEAKVPTTPEKARQAFTAAMDQWDVEAADAAVAGLARTHTPGSLFDLFAHYGARDFRDIGHKIIFVANAFRVLEVIGWRHAEPILRSLAYALLKHDGKNPAHEDLDADRPGRRNAERIAKATPAPQRPSDISSRSLLSSLRTASADAMAAEVHEWLQGGISPRTIWDGLFLGAGELLMRQPGIVSLHTLTTLNAIHYAYRTCAEAKLRHWLILQAASFLPMFRETMKARGKMADSKIDELQPLDTPTPPSVDDIYAELSRDKMKAATMAMGLLKADAANAKALTDRGRFLIFLKGTDSHDYKFSSAVMEDAEFIAPAWRDRFYAASLYWLKGSKAPDSPLVQRTRAALA
ncbi:MAG: twin-arginine translocation signal domain-containing protein [Gemmataceae bacterium]|nr:twin-arginine translocation signal domain-containing protein [Gemmata sp.]MDW8196007.1 twin-arginine translocation signal domain-containing protein [Gemmataceae bacterium]